MTRGTTPKRPHIKTTLTGRIVEGPRPSTRENSPRDLDERTKINMKPEEALGFLLKTPEVSGL